VTEERSGAVVGGRPPSGGPVPSVSVPEDVRIRPARPGDARGAVTLIAAVAAEGRWIRTEAEDVDGSRYRTIRRRYRRSWTGEGAELVALAEGRIVGALSVVRDPGPVTRHVASLGMSVAKGWRGRGVGSGLLAEALRWARWAGVEKISLTVYPDNDAARALYRKFGFVEEGRLSGHTRRSSEYQDEIVMGRWL
jgi:putative acetyltransferase